MGVASLDLQQTDAGQGKIDYGNIINKPKINGITLEGDLSTEEIGIIIPTALSELENDTGFITSDVDDLANYYDKETVDEKISLIPKFDIKVVQELPTEDISPTTLYLLVTEGDDHYVEYIYVDGEWDELGNGNIDLSDYTTYEYVNGELAKKANTADLAAVATSGSYSDLSGTPTRLGQFTNDVGYITSSALPTKTSDLTNDGEDGSSTYVENSDLATVATSGSYNDLTDKPTIDFELVEMSYGESNAWAKFIAAYQGHKIVYCRASSNSNPATGTQGRKAFMAYVNNAENPTEVEFQYVRSVSTKTSSQPVDQVYVYKLTPANGGTWTVQTRDMGPKLAQGANTTVSYSDGTYTISASQPTVNDATLTIQKNGTTVETFSANSSTNKTANITVPTKTSDVTNDSDFVNSTQVGNALAAYTYPSQDLYTQSDIDTMLAQISSLKIEVVNALPQTGNADTIYLLRVRQQGDDMYQEYFWVNSAWELIGGVDLTDYYTKTQTDTLLNAKADTSDIPTKTSDLTNDSNFPVDANYVHTDNNYTTTEKNKLAGIAAGAEVNVQSNWTQTNSSADDFIKNKPSIPTKTSDLTNDSGFITSAAIPTNVSAFNNDAGYLDSIPDDSVGLNQLDDTVVNALDRINDKADTDDLATVAFSGSYNDLADKPSIPSGQIQSDWAQTNTAEVDYIKNKPTIGNATLTIQKNGTSAGTFTANATSNKTINITVPTTAADVSALPASTKYGASIAVSINTTDYKVTTTLKDQDGNTLGTAQVIDLPLESVVVSGSYDATNKKIVLTLQNGNTIDIPVGDLVAGLQSEITSTNKLASDLVDDTGQTHKFMTSAEKTKLSGIAAGAEVNVQSDWDQTTTTADDYIKNKPSLATVATSGSYNDLSNKPTIPAAQIQSDWTQTTTTAKDYIKNKPTLATVATSGSYNDLSNKPTIPTVNNATLTIQKNGATVKTFTANASTNVTANITVPTKTSDITNDSNFVASGDLATVATSGSYNDLSNKPTIPAAQVQSNWTQTTTTAVDYIKNKPTLATVATSGSYNDLSNKPTIPTVNNATLTIQKNGTNVQTFTANQSTNATANITVPTKTSELTNNSGYITSSSLSSYLPLAGGTMTGATYGYFPATASTMVGNEYNVLLNGGDRYTLTQSGTGTLTAAQVKGLFDGALAPQYSSDGVDPNDPYVLLIENLPNVHTQTGGVFGWTCRYWVPTHFKVEFYDTYNSRGWVTAVEKTNTPTKELFVDIYRVLHGGSFTKIRITIYDSNGDAGANGHRRWGISEIFFCHPEAITPYAYANVDKANTATKATQDASGNVITTTYAKKTEIPTVNNATLTIQKNGTNVQTFTANQSTNATANITVPTKTSELTNNSNFVADASYVHTDNNYTTTEKNKLAGIAAGAEVNVQANWTQTTTTADDYIKNKPSLATVATSGSYNDLSNKPTIPTVNNATLTIQKNGSTVKTFTANASSNVTANITVPTKTSDITNDSNFTTTATAQEFAIGQGSTQPVFDGMTPVRTIEWDVSDTTYRPIYQMANTGWTYINMDITVAYRVTVTGTNINSVTDVVDRWINPISYPLTSMVCRTLSNSAATTGLKYLRAVYPTSSYLNNATYPLGMEVEMHNTTARHIKVEVFKDNSQVTWNATKPSGSIYVSSTYNGNRNLEVYGTRGWRFHQPQQMYANSANQASYISDFEAVNTAVGELKSGSTALVAGHFAFLADDGLVYDISNTTKNISVGEAKVGWLYSAVNANTAIGWTNWRAIARPNATQLGYFNHDTFALGDRIYLRCTMDSSGNIHSGNYLSKTMSAGYTWMPFGWARSATTIYTDTRFPMFYTMDSSGKLSHINGKAVAGTTYTAGSHINISGSTISAKDYVHSDTPVSTSSVTPIITNSMISAGTIEFDRTKTGDFLQLTLQTTDPGAGSPLAKNCLIGVYE